MSNRDTTIESLRQAVIVGVIRAPTAELAQALAQGMIDGDLKALEITATTPQCFEIIRTLTKTADFVPGIGTVTTVAHVEAAAEAGARFIVSPHTDPVLIERGRALDLVVIPGAFTPTEILTAHAAGADFIKVFPVSAGGGPAYIRALRGPIPNVPLWASGNVMAEEISDFLEAGVQLIGLTSALTESPGSDPKETVRARTVEVLDGLKPPSNPGPLLTIVGSKTVALDRKALQNLPSEAHVALDRHVKGRRGDAVRIAPLLQMAELEPSGDVRLISQDGFERTVSAAKLAQDGLVCFGQGGRPLSKKWGGPLRLYILDPTDLCDNVKGLSRIEVVQ